MSTASTRSGRDARQAAALAFKMPRRAGDTAVTAPEWVQVVPARPEIRANDGRFWRISDAAALIARIQASLEAGPILVDDQHRPVHGADSQAAGWCHGVGLRADAVRARIDWTPAARDKIEAREYRCISPQFRTLDAISPSTVPLSPWPPSRPPDSPRRKPPGAQPMTDIAAALGLPEAATEAAILARINEGKTGPASARMPPAPEKCMPRAAHDTAIARAGAAEPALAASKQAGREVEIETVIASAIRLTPDAAAVRELPGKNPPVRTLS